MAVSYSLLTKHLTRCIRAGLVPMIEGSPGIGKSGLVHAIAKQYNLKVIDLRLSQCDPTDLNGFPTAHGERASYLPMDTFPLEGDEVPEGYTGWLLFLDEITSAPRAVQAAAYKLILDRMVGQRKLNKKLAIVAAGNKLTDGAIVEEMSTALQSRMIHFELEVDSNEWVDWADENTFDHRITSFIKFRPDLLYTFKPDHTGKTYACPRTWEFADKLLKQSSEIPPEDLPLYAGTLSEGVAMEFRVFTQIKLPSIDSIAEHPTTTPVPQEPSVLFALTGAIAGHTNRDNASRLMQFVERLPIEFQVVTLRAVVRRHKDLLDIPAIQGWVAKNAQELF